MAEQIALINVRPVWARAPLVLLAVAALYAAWYCVRWGLGNTMAETAPATYATDPAAAIESAEGAVRLAPRDPAARLMLARLNQISFDPRGVERALREYEAAAALAPNDYLVWMESGRARAALGDTVGGVAALRRAVALAPNYAQPRWHLGNALLRSGDTEAAFAELRRAAEAEPSLRPQVFNLAWQVYGPDMARVIDVVGRTPAARAQLVGVLAARGRLDDALAVWGSLGEAERREQREAATALMQGLYSRGQYGRALSVFLESGAAPQGLAAERVFDGSFEGHIEQGDRHRFQWSIMPAAGAQIAIDARAASAGRRSLQIAFNASGQLDFRGVSQVVVVEPSTRYRLTYSMRTQELRSVATLVTAVADMAPPGTALAESAPAPPGTGEWRQHSVEFTTGPKTGAVAIRIVRAPCPEGICPIYGKIWYDDFNLERAGGRPGAR